MDSPPSLAEAAPFLQLEPLLDQTDALNLLIARMASIQMQDWHMEKPLPQNGGQTLAYKIRIENAYLGVYLPKGDEPALKDMGEVPVGLNWTPICTNDTLADDIMRFKIKVGRYDIYSKKSAEGLLYKLNRDLSVDNQAPAPAQIEYAAAPDFENLETYEKNTETRQEHKALKALRASLAEREVQRRAARLAVLMLQKQEVAPAAVLALLNRPAHELAEIYEQIEELARNLEEGTAASDETNIDLIESICQDSRSGVRSGLDIQVFADDMAVIRLARHLTKVSAKQKEIDAVLASMFENAVHERRRKSVDTSYWAIDESKPCLSWPLTGSLAAKLYAQAMSKKNGRTKLAQWVGDYLALQTRMQFKPVGQNRIDLAYAALRELDELERAGQLGSGPAYELQFLCERYEKLCLRLPLVLERARSGAQALDESLDGLVEFMRRRDELVEKIREIIGALDQPYLQTTNDMSLAQASARARLALAVLSGELCVSDLHEEKRLLESAQSSWEGVWPAAEAKAYLNLMEAHNAQRAALIGLASDKSGKERRRELDHRFKEKLAELESFAKIDAETIRSDYRKTHSHVGYKSGENRRIHAYQSDEMRLRKAIMIVDGEIHQLHNMPREQIDSTRLEHLEDLRDILSPISHRLHAACDKSAKNLREWIGTRCVDETDRNLQTDQLFFPEYLKSLHYAGLDVRDLVPEMGQLEEQNFSQSTLPLQISIVMSEHSDPGTVPMRVFARNEEMGISFSQYFEFDFGAQMGKNQGKTTPIEEVLYGPRIDETMLRELCHAKQYEYAAKLDYGVLFPNEYYNQKLNDEEALNDLQVCAQVGRPEALRGKRVLNNGQWEETYPFTVPTSAVLERPGEIKNPSPDPKAAKILDQMTHSHVLRVRMAELAQHLDSKLNHEVRQRHQKQLQRQAVR